MFNQILLLIYHLFLHGDGRKIDWIEQYLDCNSKTAISFDDVKNESKIYEAIFSKEHRPRLEQLYLKLLDEINKTPYEQCGSMLDALEFVQIISANALWKYHQNVGAMIEEFVRNFDRLDAPSERMRLYKKSQSIN